MSTLDTNNKIVKIISSYIIASISAVIFDRIYSLFSHGVSSAYMTFMFLYPLVGGALVYCLIYFFQKNLKFENLRLSFNFYNSGIAILTIGSLLEGILQIAGTSSDYTIYYFIFGFLISLISFSVITIKLTKNKCR